MGRLPNRETRDLCAGAAVLHASRARKERVPVPGTTWVLRSPWLWKAGRAYARGLRAAHTRRWAAEALSLGSRGLGFGFRV